MIRGEHVLFPDLLLEQSNVWDIVVVPIDRLRPGTTLGVELTPDGKGYYGYVPDIWMGNSGWRK